MKPKTNQNEIDAAYGPTTEKHIAEYTLQGIVEQFELVGYHDDIGHQLVNNVAFLALKRYAAAQQEQPAGEVDLRDRIEAGLSVQNAEAKLWALLTGLECRNVDDFMARADTESYLRFGNAYITRVKELITKPAADPVRGDGDVCKALGCVFKKGHIGGCSI